MKKNKKFYHDIDLEEVEFETEPETEPDSLFGHLYEAEDSCPYCNYYGPMRATRKGYRCVECRKLVVRFQDDEE